MYVSHETPEQTDSRLRQVLAEAELKVYPAAYTFVEVPIQAFPQSSLAGRTGFRQRCARVECSGAVVGGASRTVCRF
jgi:hypothetical protein